MKRITLGLVIAALLSSVVVLATDGPLTALMNLKVRTDENGYLRVSGGTAGATDGPLTAMANLRGRTDENGYLRVAITGSAALTTITGTSLQLGTNPATAASGWVSTSNNSGIAGRNAANSANIVVAYTDSSNVVQVGDATNAVYINSNNAVRTKSYAFASLPTGVTGMIATVTDSNTATWGATVAAGGANVVLAYYNGTVWTVAGK